MLITHSMKVCRVKDLATYLLGQGHNFNSYMVRNCNTQNFVSGPYILQGDVKSIITSYDYYP